MTGEARLAQRAAGIGEERWDLGRAISRTFLGMGNRVSGREGAQGSQTTVMGALGEQAWGGGERKSLQSQNAFGRWFISALFICRWGNWGTQKHCTFSKITQGEASAKLGAEFRSHMMHEETLATIQPGRKPHASCVLSFFCSLLHFFIQ